MLSNTSRYAIRALLYLAVNAGEKKRIGIKIIAKDLNIPAPFLGKILQTLAKSKIIESTKGPNGGFGITDATLNVNLMTIIKLINGDDLFERCLITDKLCSETDSTSCILHKHYEEIRTKIKNVFSEHTIGSIANEFIVSGKNNGL